MCGIRFLPPGRSVLAGIETNDLFIIALRAPPVEDVVLEGQDSNVEIDLSQATLNVVGAGSVELYRPGHQHRNRPEPGHT